MRISAALAIIACFALSPGTAQADPYTVLPNGDVIFNTVMTSRGVFTCIRGVPCSGSGTDTLTLGSGTNTATLRFTGVSSSFGVGNVAKPVVIGSFHVTAPEDFTFPLRMPQSHRSIFWLDFTMQHTSPVAATRRERWLFGPGGRANVKLQQGFGSSINFPTGANPPGSNYTAITYSIQNWPFTIAGRGTTNITAKVGAVPEPSTLLLLGSGLAYGAYVRRRKRSLQP